MQNRRQKKDKSYLVGLILLLLSGVFIFLYFLPEQIPRLSNSVEKEKEFETKVNKHLFATSQQMELQRKKMEIETADLVDKKPSQSQTVESSEMGGVDFTPDPRAEALLNSLRREQKGTQGPENSNDLIQAELFELEQHQHYSEEYKKEYARQFIENARQAGYNVKMNDQYKIISVVPIRKPAQNFNLFQSEGGAAQ